MFDIDFAWLGVTGNPSAGTSGTPYFDDFSSSRLEQGGALAPLRGELSGLSEGDSLEVEMMDEFLTVDILPIGEE